MYYIVDVMSFLSHLFASFYIHLHRMIDGWMEESGSTITPQRSTFPLQQVRRSLLQHGDQN